MNFTLSRARIDKLPRSELIAELEFVAARLRFVQFGKREFRQYGKFSADPIRNEFGTWTAAMEQLRQKLDARGIKLEKRARGIPEAVMLLEMERVWRLVGHRPSRAEWQASKARISYSAIRKHFKGWRNACAQLVEIKRSIPVELPAGEREGAAPIDSGKVSSGLRMRVLVRDNCTCKICGRSPEKHPGLVLHVDHVRPLARGGKSVIENLQTACEDCNLGKGAQEIPRRGFATVAPNDRNRGASRRGDNERSPP